MNKKLNLEFPLGKIDFSDNRFMQRTNKQKWEKQVQRILRDIKEFGQHDPITLAKLKGQTNFIRVAGFTRSEALKRLNQKTCKAWVYTDISEKNAKRLNISDNTMRYDLEPIDKAKAMYDYKRAGYPVDGEDSNCLTNVFDMSKTEIYRWLKVVREGAPEIKDAIREGLPLTHAVKLVDTNNYDPSVIKKDLDNDWNINDLQTALDVDVEPITTDPQVDYDELSNEKQRFITLLSQTDFDEMSNTDFSQLRKLLKRAVKIMGEYSHMGGF